MCARQYSSALMNKGILSYAVNWKTKVLGVAHQAQKMSAAASCIFVEPQKVKLKEAEGKWGHQVLGNVKRVRGIRTHTCAHTHMHTHAQTHMHTLSHTHTQTHTKTQTCTHYEKLCKIWEAKAGFSVSQESSHHWKPLRGVRNGGLDVHRL